MTTDWQRLGASRVLVIPELYSGNSRTGRLAFDVPSWAGGVEHKLLLGLGASLHAVALPPGSSDYAPGVHPVIGERGKRGLLRGGVVSASGTDQLTVSPVLFVINGVPHGAVSQSITLDQLDGDAQPLGPAESYEALFYVEAAGLQVVKSVKGASPVPPTLPAGAIRLRGGSRVLVDYQPGGTSIVDAGDLREEGFYERLSVTPGPGLTAVMGAGTVDAYGSRRFWGSEATVPIIPSTTTWIWQGSAGAYSTTSTGAAPDSAAFLVAEVDADATTAIAVRQLAPIAGRSQEIALELSGALAVSDQASTIWTASDVAYIDAARVFADSGDVKVDFLVNGSSIFPSSATEDLRPVPDSEGWPEVLEGASRRCHQDDDRRSV